MTQQEEIEQATQIWNAYLKRKHLRKTLERQRVLEAVYAYSSHFSADEMATYVSRDFLVSRATVYNTLELLVDCRLVVKHQFSSQQTVYEKITSSATHHHRICINCGAVSEFTDQKIQKVIQSREFSAFTTTYYSLYLYGYCKNCIPRMKRLNHI